MGRVAVAAVQTLLALLVIGVAPSLAGSTGSYGAGAGSSSRSWAAAAPTSGATYTAIPPRRILDTRPTIPSGNPTNIGLSGKFVAGTVRRFAVAGARYVGGGSAPAIPANAVAITGNLTIVYETAPGVIDLGPAVTPDGATSSLNFVPGDTRANNVTLGLATDGYLSAVYRTPSAGATTDLIFDLTGYFTPGAGGATYHTVVTPGRVLDTRPTYGGVTHIGPLTKLPNRVVKSFPVVGVTGLGWSSPQVPSTAVAVTGNVTVTNATSLGYVALGPTMSTFPSTSTANVAAWTNVANGVTVALYRGSLSVVWCGTTGSSADVIFDVTGYFTSGPDGLYYYPIAPSRVLDSSKNLGITGPFPSRTAQLFTLPGVPTGAAGISGNLTLLTPSTNGWALITPEIVAAPKTSTVNASAGHSEANGFDVTIGTSNHVALEWAGEVGSRANLSLDITGYWTPDTSAPATWTLDISDPRADRWQDPDLTACTAAATASMLNDIYYTGSASGLVWQPTTSYTDQEAILAYERANMTMLTTSAGTDPHGWRNALNYYGWGSVTAAVYRDSSYGSFDTAAKAVVSALARYHKPVGILAHAGRHSQYVVGYMVTGDDPSTGSTNFTIMGVDLTDTLQSAGYRDTWVYVADWRSGSASIQFSPYLETDSPYQDPIDGQVGTTEWYGKWVVIDPVG
jgi:hypothetical protein